MGRLNWRMPDRLGQGMVAAMLIGGLRSRHFSAKQGRRGVGEGFARGRSDA